MDENNRIEWIDMVRMEFGESSESTNKSATRNTKQNSSLNKNLNAQSAIFSSEPINDSKQRQQYRQNRRIRSSTIDKIDGRLPTMKSTTIVSSSSKNKFRTCLIIICLLQACVILCILGLTYYNKWPLFVNLNSQSTSNQALIRSSTSNSFVESNIYRVYSNGQNTSKVLVGLAKGCNQRIHDLPRGVKCSSSRLGACKRVEALSGHRPTDEFDGSHMRKITLITSTRSGKRHDVRMTPIKWVYNCPANEQPNCHFKTRLSVYLADHHQTIIGWGGALTDSSINNILSLSVNGTRSLLNDYFSRENGLGYNLIRITIGGSDFSGRFYTNDDVKSGSEDLGMEKFHLLEEDTLYKIPMLRLIQTEYEHPVKLFGSIWSPPVWMKTNNHFNKGQLRGAIGTDQANADRYFRSLAELKARFIDAYQRESIKFWGLTIMNEPFFAKQPFIDFNTMIFPTNDYATYVATILGPRFKQDESLRHIKLMIHDDNRRFLRSDTEHVINRTDVQRFIDGITTHGYIDEEFDAMTEMWEKYQRRFFILPDELCSGHLPFMDKALIGNWERGMHYAIDMLQSLRHRASGWVDWNMALDIEGGPGWLGGRLDSPVIVDAAEDTYYKSPMYYTIGHFSRYVPEGSIKIADRIINNKYDYRFETVTFVTPRRQLVTIILNENPYNVELIIEPLKSSGHIAPRQNAGYQIVVEPESITTVLYPLPSEYTSPPTNINP